MVMFVFVRDLTVGVHLKPCMARASLSLIGLLKQIFYGSCW